MEAPPGPPADPTPFWISDSVVYQRLTEYLRLTMRMTRSPGEFIETWSSGVEVLPNPLHFWLAAMAVYTAFYNGGLWLLLGATVQDTFWGSLLRSLTQFAYVPALALFAHLFCRLGGGRRPVRATVGATLFAAAGPSSLLSGALMLWLLVSHRLGLPLHLASVVHQGAGSDTLAMVRYSKMPVELLVIPSAVNGVYLSTMLTRLHRVRWGWPVLGFVVGMLCPALLGVVAGSFAQRG